MDIKNLVNMEMINEMINNLKIQTNNSDYERFVKLVEHVIKIF